MTRAERVRLKAERLELRAIRQAARATSQADPFGRSAIRGGEAASRNWRQADALRRAAAEREAAAGREKRAKKLTRGVVEGGGPMTTVLAVFVVTYFAIGAVVAGCLPFDPDNEGIWRRLTLAERCCVLLAVMLAWPASVGGPGE